MINFMEKENIFGKINQYMLAFFIMDIGVAMVYGN